MPDPRWPDPCVWFTRHAGLSSDRCWFCCRFRSDHTHEIREQYSSAGPFLVGLPEVVAIRATNPERGGGRP